MAIQKLNNFRGGLNLTQSNEIENNEFTIAKNVFYNNSKQLQTRRGYTAFGSQIGSSPITSYFFYQRDDTNERIAVCNSGTAFYKLVGTTWTSVQSNLQEFETRTGMTANRTRWDHVVYKNVIYTGDGVNPYASYDGTTYTQISIGGALTCTFDNSTDYVNDTAHGLLDNDEIFFVETSGTLPAEITEYQVYYVIAVDADNFQITNDPNGTAIDFTDNGTGTLSYRKLTEPRYRYLHSFNNTIFGVADSAPSTLYYSATAPSSANSIDTNFAVIGKDEAGIINGLNDFSQLVTIFKNEQVYSFNLASEDQDPVDVSTGGFADRSIHLVGNNQVYFNERGIDLLLKRGGVDGVNALESKPFSDNVRDLFELIEEKQYNASTGWYIKVLNNYYVSFDTNNDNKPDTTLVYNALVGAWTQYTFPPLYDYGYFINSDGEYQYLFASASGGQMYQFETGFTDAGQDIEVEIQTKDFDFGDPAQQKTFGFVDVVGYKQEGGEIDITVLVDGEQRSLGTITDTQLDLNNPAGSIGVNPLGNEPLGSAGIDTDDDDLPVYPFEVRLPMYERGAEIAINMKSTGVQWILEKMRIDVNAEPVQVFGYSDIL